MSIDTIRRGSTFYTSTKARQFSSEFLAKDKKGYFAINLGARVPEKRWPVEKYAELASKISDQYAMQTVVFTNPGMEELTDKFILNYVSDRECIPAPLLSLDRVAALLEKVNFLITGDTALMHLAFGVKCPTLVLFTHTRPEVVKPDDCQHVPCFIEDRSSLDECGLPYGMADIPIEYALRRFEILYAQLD
ncbi:MAG TPA: lipopolysaccharide heptosyltransferase family protein [Gammaproteobacteria bacterium]|nr:lipopolysaccharide heptosyltransferase family protein [Gammaproteobacteria bacterium]